MDAEASPAPEDTEATGATGTTEATGASDADLLAAHVAGDPDAFAVLVARHRDRLWAVALRTAGDPETAADGLQEALVAAYRRAGTFRGQAAVTTWLHRIVVNACLDRLRSARSRRTEPLPHDLADRGERHGRTGAPGGPPAAPQDPAEHSVEAERRREILAALAELPAEQRAALVLVDLEGFGVAEAAEVLDCAVGTVKSRCSRGRRRLAVSLAHLLGDGNHADAGPVPPPAPRGATPTRSEDRR